MAGETAAFIMAEGLIPTSPSSKGSKKPYSSSGHYNNMSALRNGVYEMDDVAIFSFKGDVGNGTPEMIIYGRLEPTGKHLDLNVDIIPRSVMEGTLTLEQSYIKYKNKVGIKPYRSYIENWAKNKGYKSIRYYNERSTGPATGRMQSSKRYKL